MKAEDSIGTTEKDDIDCGVDGINSDNPQEKSCVDLKSIGLSQEPLYQTILEQVRDRIRSTENMPMGLML